MFKDNLISLRKINNMSQEELAERLMVSRQTVSKYETGESLPDIEKCRRLADHYGVTIDSLLRTETEEELGTIPPAPVGKNIWGSVTINERGQIVIPKVAREKFGLTGGQRLIVLSDEEGIALISAEKFEARLKTVMEYGSMRNEEDS